MRRKRKSSSWQELNPGFLAWATSVLTTELWPADNHPLPQSCPYTELRPCFQKSLSISSFLMNRVFPTTPNIVLMAHTEWLPTGTFSTTCVVHGSGLWWLVVVQGSQFTSQSTGSLSWGSWVQLPMTVSFSLSYPSPLSLYILFLNIFFITSQLQTRPLFFLLINALGTRLILYICYQCKLSGQTDCN